MANRQLWGGETSPVGLSVEDARHHCYVIGKTGSGKSSLLRNMILQQIALGHGVAVIDPHGDLAESLLGHIPPWRADDLCYFNPGDVEHPASFNVLANVPPEERNLVASGIVGAFKNIFPDSWGPRMEYIFHHAITALAECPNATLLGVNRILTDDAYRRWVVRQVTDPFVRDFWEVEFESYDAAAENWPAWRGPTGDGVTGNRFAAKVVSHGKCKMENETAGRREFNARRLGRPRFPDAGHGERKKALTDLLRQQRRTRIVEAHSHIR